MIFVTWWTFQTCCSLLGMLGIFGEVGRPNSLRPLPSPKFLRPIPRLFREQIFLGRYWDFFETKIFETDTETFFETKVFETDTETFFRDQIFSRPIPRLFFETKYFRDRYRDFFSRPKFSRPRPILSKNWEKSRYREVSRRDVTLWLAVGLENVVVWEATTLGARLLYWCLGHPTAVLVFGWGHHLTSNDQACAHYRWMDGYTIG